jgi:hypothetical protein
MITRLQANIKYLQTYTCAGCGTSQQGTTAHFYCETTQGLEKFLHSPPRRAHDMPVGWASYAHDKFRCPRCKK